MLPTEGNERVFFAEVFSPRKIYLNAAKSVKKGHISLVFAAVFRKKPFMSECGCNCVTPSAPSSSSTSSALEHFY